MRLRRMLARHCYIHVIGDRSPLRSTWFRQLLCELSWKMKNFFLLCSLVTLSAAANIPVAEYVYGGNRWFSARVSVGTFNAFLFRGALDFVERKDTLIKVLQGLLQISSPRNQWISRSPDVLCLQEVFRRSDAKDIVEALRSQYPYHASFQDLDAEPVDARPTPQRACTPQEARAAALCLEMFCSRFPRGNAFFNCTLVECGHVLFQLPQACISCLSTELGAAEDAQVNSFTRCALAIPRNDYTDAYGLLLLSRYPLSNVATIDYLDSAFTLFVPRGYITARVQPLSGTVLCTHLTPKFSDVDYVGPPMFSSVDQQQANEIKRIHEVVEQTSRIILLGDFNHGPATPGITWNVPLNFGLMTARGLFSANALWCGQCTYCTNNILTGGTFPNYLIDHVYLPTSWAPAVIRVERIFDTICTSSGLPLSDHYGVSATILVGRVRRSMCPYSSGGDITFLDMDDIEYQVDAFCTTP